MSEKRRDYIRKMILHLTRLVFESVPGTPLLWHDLLFGFSNSMAPPSEDEIRTVVTDLVQRGLLEIQRVPSTGEMPEVGYLSVPDGRDFEAAGCPNERIDRFSARSK